MNPSVSYIQNLMFFSALKELPWILEIWLYGSRARGDHGEFSDIDLALITQVPPPNSKAILQDLIEEADTLLKIDCLDFGELLLESPLRANIIKDHIVLYKRGPNGTEN